MKPNLLPAMAPDINKEYATPEGVELLLHENRYMRVFWNGRFHYIEGLKYPKGAVVVPVFQNGDVLLVEQVRAPAIGLSWEFPRGGGEAGEPTRVAAARELREETGYSIEPERLIYLGRVGPDTATINGTQDVYYVAVPEGTIPGDLDTREIRRVLRVPRAEFHAHIRAGDIVCGISLAAYALARLHEERSEARH
jgi:8-oxo-dGTP pyrophosphatase MutT (NUDIX family)